MSSIIVHKGRTNIVTVDLGIDVSADTFTSEIRSQPSQTSTLIATWVVTKLTTGHDGKLVLTMDDTVSAQINAASGYMDIKRLSGGEPLAVFDKSLPVTFQGTVTV